MIRQSQPFQQCIDDCLDCHRTCLQEAMNHCLQAGGEHVAPAHFRLMDELRADLPDRGRFHAQCFTLAHTCVRRVRRCVRRMRPQLRAGRRDGRVHTGVPPLRRELPDDGSGRRRLSRFERQRQARLGCVREAPM